MSSDDHWLGDFTGPCTLPCPESCELPQDASVQLFDDVVAFSMCCPNEGCDHYVRFYPKSGVR